MKVELSRGIYIDKCEVIKINKNMLRLICGYALSAAKDIHYSKLCVDLGGISCGIVLVGIYQKINSL